jgi:hypothetical protein
MSLVVVDDPDTLKFSASEIARAFKRGLIMTKIANNDDIKDKPICRCNRKNKEASNEQKVWA